MTRAIVTFPDDALLTVPEVAFYLRVNKTTAYEMARDESFPVLRIGKQIRIPFWSLKQWVAKTAGTTYPQPAIEPDPIIPQH